MNQPSAPRGRPFEKNRIIGASAIIAAATVAWCLREGSSLEDWLRLARATARIAFPFFVLSFAASGLYTWRRHPLTAWCLRNRRELGLAFALMMFVHLGVLAGIAIQFPDHYALATPLTLLPGGLFYFVLGVLVFTSFAAWKIRLSRPLWKRIHVFGTHVMWFGFTAAASLKSFEEPAYGLAVAFLIGLIVLRWWGRGARDKMFAARRAAASNSGGIKS